MIYEKQTFTNGQVLTADCLNRMEEGIKGACDAVPPACDATDCSKVLSHGENGCEWVDTVGKATDAGGAVFGDCQNNEAGEFAVAFGSETKATGKAVIAGGLKIDRSGAPKEPADSDWRYNEAIGEASVAIGMGAVAYSRASKSMGYRTQTGYPPSAEHAAARPEALVRSDYPKDNVGQAAVAIGSDTAAVGNNSLAACYKTQATGGGAVAIGNGTKASGSYSMAAGYSSTASGSYAHAEGQATNASNTASHAEGYTTKASGVYSHAEGYKTTSSGAKSHAEGSESKAGAENAHAEGYKTTASGENSHAEGSNTTASGARSHAEGNSTTAEGHNSHAEGTSTIAVGSSAHAEGGNTEAHGKWSHAEGRYTKATGEKSHAEGYYTIAAGANSHVQGKFNVEDTEEKYAHIVGAGTKSSERSNIHTLDWKGNAWLQGTMTTNGADYAEFFEWADGNPNNEDRVGYLVALEGEKIKLASLGDDIVGVISGTAAVLGDNSGDVWKKKYLTDDFGRIIYDMVEEFDTEIDPETNEEVQVSIGVYPHPRINPDYDSSLVYVPREERQEWDKVGMLGKLYVRDDGTCTVGGYGCSGENGVLIHSEERTNIRIMKRIDKNIVLVLMR